MIIESVKCLKTLRAGDEVWLKDTVFPNPRCPSIPDVLLAEVLTGRSTVEVLSYCQEIEEFTSLDPVSAATDVPEFEKGTSTIQDVNMGIVNTEIDPPEDVEPAKVEKPAPKKSSKPSRGKATKAGKKTSLVTRK